MKETDELLQLKSALEQAEQQNQLLNREYSQLLKEKEVSIYIARTCSYTYKLLLVYRMNYNV